MTTINKIKFVDNQVRANNDKIKTLGDNYILSQSSRNKQRKTPIIYTQEQIFIRQRNQYISCLNLGRIKKISLDKLYQYGIVFNEATGKYESVKINSKFNYYNIPKLIAENSHIWNDVFNPENIIKDAINTANKS